MSRVPVKLLVLFAFLLSADQYAKYLVRSQMYPLETIDIFAFVRLQYVRNRGIAFGLLDGYASVIIPVGIVIVVMIVIVAMMVRDRQGVTWPLALLLAGSVGNLIDRLLFGSVIDYIRLPHWPAFNLADIFIVFGVTILTYQLLLRGEPVART
ncbi:MAG: signal peptidase II [Thermoleophilia bacterium]